MFDVQGITLHFGARPILKNASFKIEDGCRAAIIGPNGMGKSTLLKIVAGVLQAEAGTVTYPKKSEIGYLPQDMSMVSEMSVEDECRTIFQEVLEHEAEMRLLEERMAVVPHGTPEFDDIADRYEYLMHELERRDVFTMDSEIGKVLDGLGFKPKDKTRACREFSGGWQMRIALARILLRNPDILLLDEPTNHLDIETIEWLGEWIAGHEGSVLMVSHERSFMDKLVSKVIEVDNGNTIIYNGNYTSSLEQREERREIALRTYQNQQQQISHQQKFIDRFRYQASKASLVQSRIRMLDKIELVEAPTADMRTIHFRFPPAPRSGKEVLVATGIKKSFGPLNVLGGVDVTIYRGEKVALVGVNGAGKTTLMRVLAGRQEADAGKITLGSNVDLAYFAQYDVEDLHPANTVHDEFLSGAPLEISSQARSILGAFLFSGEDIDKKVGVLSGGERTRLRLAKMLCGKANLLLMDEPTNHLDLGSRLTLESALKQYDGAVLLVSHDRYFLDAVTTRVIEVENSVVTSYPGTYSEYLEQRAKRLEATDESAPKKPSSLPALPKETTVKSTEERERQRIRESRIKDAMKRQKQVRARCTELEGKLAEAEDNVGELENELSLPANTRDRKKLGELTEALAAARSLHASIEEQWFAAQQELEDIEGLLSEM